MVRWPKGKFSGIAMPVMTGYLIVIIILGITVLFINTTLNTTQVSFSHNTNEYVPMLNIANDIKSIVLKQQSLAQEFILTGGNQQLKIDYRTLDRQFEKKVQEYCDTASDQTDRDKLAKVKRQHDNFTLIANHLFEYKEKNRDTLVNTLMKSYKRTNQDMINSAQDLVADNLKHISSSEQESIDNINRTRQLMFISGAMAVIVCIILTIIITRIITRPIKTMVTVSQQIANGDLTHKIDDIAINELSNLGSSFNIMIEQLKHLITYITDYTKDIYQSSQAMHESAGAYQQIHNALNEVSQGAQQQAIGIGTIYKSADKVSEAIFHINKSIQAINETSQDATQMASQQMQAAKNVTDQMETIQSVVENLGTTVRDLDDYLAEITIIINSISNFAKQTNLLSLNAAIEAAKAGENGRGFAVVADEIRKLANESSKLVDDIRSIIAAIQERSKDAVKNMENGILVVNEGTEIISDSSRSLEDIIKIINVSADQAREVSVATESISNNSNQMLKEISDIKKFSDETVENSQRMSDIVQEQTKALAELSNAAGFLAKIANQLQNMVSRFKIK